MKAMKGVKKKHNKQSLLPFTFFFSSWLAFRF